MKRQAGIDPCIDPGGKIGEFTVWVDDRLVGQKEHFLRFPGKEKILAAVMEALHGNGKKDSASRCCR